MAVLSKANQTASRPKTENYVSIEVPVTVRMNVLADGEIEGREIVNALMGNGNWIKCHGPQISFALKTQGPNR